MDYNKTLNLPQTSFPMRAGLPQKEPGMAKAWDEGRLFYRMVENNAGKPPYTFHDGPPYANADIHLGTALNKILKDFIVRYKNMTGRLTNFIPGWDTHGLPIELKAIKELGLDSGTAPIELRKQCRDFALRHVERQKDQFKRLGTLADYDHPYLTLKPAFEAKQVEIFGEMAKKGYIYKDLKSVYWCPECATALAEAEIEYHDDPCDSIYVKFGLTEDKDGVIARMGAEDLSKASVVIWTTTTWTLPANLAVCLGPDFEYVLVDANGEYLLVAKELTEAVMKAAGIADYTVLGSAAGKELEYVKYRHPFLDRVSPLIVGDHVTLEAGTGCVHTAPGHGVEDFDVCAKNYPEVGVVVPVDKYGKMTAEAGAFIEGLPTEKANPVIQKKLEESGNLLALSKIQHTYPHCWRCRQPILFRATEQWFCSVEDFKKETVAEIEKVKFYPDWGKDRLISMVQDRNAWCISRQRVWGVPIPVFYCDDCGEYIIDDATITAVRELFAKEGSDAWYLKSAAEILPSGFSCKCGGKSFTKETDIMDVWFDSGTSHAAVLDSGEWENQSWPCDLYLEGTDQYRGWFQSSLLTSVAWKGCAPYKNVCTHGWVVDGEGGKMSKSLGNVIDPIAVADEFGADVLRLWVASVDYHADVRMSKDALGQISEAYRKIRNTARFLLGNLSDFDPDKDTVKPNELNDLDKWALSKLDELIVKCREAYENFDFHIVYHALHNFCTVDMSSFYLDVVKDRLYVEKAESPARRAAQTAMYHILIGLDLLIAPILCFTAEEIWGFAPKSKKLNPESVVFNEIPIGSLKADEDFMGRWDRLIAVRGDVNKALELSRAEKKIGKSLDAQVTLTCDKGLYEFLQSFEDLATVFIVSAVELAGGEKEGLSVEVSAAKGEKCERCWIVSETTGSCAEHPTLCKRCAATQDLGFRI
ncbi:MAG: isoleucine--tRNA ligase [Oscillospiraceae bacterium]|nr:isoleucine--tRNA ligase [Oscillospiraceae bacterium]